MNEPANRTIENTLSAFQKNWDNVKPLLMLAYRSSIHESTGILFGHTVILSVGMVLGRINPEKYKDNLHYENT